MKSHKVRYHQGDDSYQICSPCCRSNYYQLNRCLGGHDSPCYSDYYEDQSCETQLPVWKNWYPALSNIGIICRHVYYIDYNRFKYARF